jgi:hypothetical protein
MNSQKKRIEATALRATSQRRAVVKELFFITIHGHY